MQYIICQRTLKMIGHIFFILSITVFQLSFGLEVRSCGSKKPLPLSVSVDGCNKEPCKAVNKKTIHFAIDFEARKCSQRYIYFF